MANPRGQPLRSALRHVLTRLFDIVSIDTETEGVVVHGEIEEALDATKETARQTLSELIDLGLVTVDEGAGKYGAHLYDLNRRVSGFLRLDDRGRRDEQSDS